MINSRGWGTGGYKKLTLYRIKNHIPKIVEMHRYFDMNVAKW